MQKHEEVLEVLEEVARPPLVLGMASAFLPSVATALR